MHSNLNIVDFLNVQKIGCAASYDVRSVIRFLNASVRRWCFNVHEERANVHEEEKITVGLESQLMISSSQLIILLTVQIETQVTFNSFQISKSFSEKICFKTMKNSKLQLLLTLNRLLTEELLKVIHKLVKIYDNSLNFYVNILFWKID